MHQHRKLNVWNAAIDLSIEIYKLTSTFPEAEQFGLIQQMRRSAVSIPSNIAEGAGRGTNKDFSRFLSLANGPAMELETQLLISLKLGYLNEESYSTILLQIDGIQKMIYRLKNSLLTETKNITVAG